MLPLDDLRAAVSGPVLTPADEGFAEEVTGFNLATSYAPDVAVGVTNEDDVVAAVTFAALYDLTIHVQATGHGASGAVTGGMLIITKRLDSVAIDPETGIATIAAGTRWRSVVAAAAEHGLTAITGSSPSVGAIGYTLGGGLGPLARSHGFSSDYALGFRVVTADGVAKVASATKNPDLFWALRGGKFGLGVVIEMQFQLVPLTEIYGGAMFFEAGHIDAVLRGWTEWTETADPDVTSSVAVVRFPPFEQVPEVFRGKTMLSLRFAYPGDPETGKALAAPLRALAPALIDTIETMPTTAMGTIHADPDQPAPSWVEGLMLTGVGDTFADVFLGFAGADATPPIVVAELRHLGPRTAMDVEGSSAVGGRQAAYALTIVAVMPPGFPTEALPAFWATTLGVLAPWTAPQTNVNFAGHPAALARSESWPEDIAARLDAVTKKYDPEGLFTYA